MTEFPPCDPTLELCIDDIAPGNETVATETSGGFEFGKLALLAVGGVQATAGVLTLLDEKDITPMSIVNSAFGAIGFLLGVQQLFLAQPYEECPEEAPVEEEVVVEEVALRQDPTEEVPAEEVVAVEEPSCGPSFFDSFAQWFGILELIAGSTALALLFTGDDYSDFLTYLNYGADGLAIVFGLVSTLTFFGIFGGSDDAPAEVPVEEVPEEEVVALI